MDKVKFQYRGEGLYLADEKHWGDSYGDYYPAADYEALEAKLSRLVEAAECALTALNIASRQLTEDMKLVLNGKRWGGIDIDRLKSAIEAAKGGSKNETKID